MKSAHDKSLFINQDRRGDLSQYHKKSEKSMRELAALKMEACEQERQMYDFAGVGNSSIASLQTKQNKKKEGVPPKIKSIPVDLNAKLKIKKEADEKQKLN